MQKSTQPSRTVPLVWIPLIGWWTVALLCGCAREHPAVLVIPADREIQYLPANQWLTNHPSLYLVPPARMQELLRALAFNPNAISTGTNAIGAP